MSLSAYLTIMLLNLAGAASPGPDIILVTRMATKSRRHAVAASLGIQVGVLMWCTLTVLGAAAVLTAFPEILGFVQLVGGAWLVWMGFNMVRGGWAQRTSPPVSVAAAEASLGSPWSSFRTGLLTNLSNPKIVLFLAALVAPHLPANPTLGLAVLLILSLGLSALALFLLLSFVISTNALRRRMLAAGPWIDIVAGSFFVIVGAVLVANGIAAIAR